MGKTYGNALTAGVFRTSVFAKAGSERVLRQAEHLPVAEAAKHAIFSVDVLVHACHIFIHISASAGRLYEIVSDSAA